MIILMKKRNLATICVLVLAIVIFWSAYHYLGGQRTISYEDQDVLPTTAEVAEPKVAPEAPVDLQEDTLGDASVEEGSFVLQAETVMPVEDTPPSSPQDEIIQMRLERNRNRDMQVEALEKMVSSSSITPETKLEAEQKLLQNSEERFLEAQTETLLKTKGYQNTLVLIDFNNAKVFVGSELTEEDYLKIGDLVHKGTNFKLEEIIIIPK